MTTIKSLMQWILLIIVSMNAVIAQENGNPLVLPQIEVVPIQDTQLNRQYELYIELPEDYSEHPEKKYPVLYYTDAMWHMEILSGAAEFILEDVILVGISWQKDIDPALIKEHGTHVSRYRDYTVTKSDNQERQAKYQFGSANDHLGFIRNDVIPFVETNYQTDSDKRSYFGYSAGGLFATYILMSQPDTFKNYILGSPSLNGDMPVLSNLESNKRISANVFISYGSEEKELSTYGDQFINLLNGRNDDGLAITHKIIEGTHQTAFPQTGVESVKWLSRLIKEQ